MALRDVLRDDPVIISGIRLASPSLHLALTRWLSGAPTRNPAAPLKGLLYVLRMATRPTPFGMFGAIGMTAIGERSDLSVDGSTFRTSTRADMAWLYGFLGSVTNGARGAAPLHVNDLIIERGERAWVLDARHVTAHGGNLEYPKGAITATAGIEFVRDYGRIDSLAELEAAMAHAFEVPASLARALLETLQEVGYLVASVPAPVGDVMRRAFSLAASVAPSLSATLDRITSSIDALDAKPVAERTGDDLAAAEDALRAAFAFERSPLQVDMAVTFAGTLAAPVLDDVALLADAAIRMAQLTTDLDDMRKRFEKRFEGVDSLVPLIDLVDPDFGIGVPDRSVPSPAKPRPRNGRSDDGGVVALLSESIRSGAFEVELADEIYDVLLPPREHADQLPGSLEISFRVDARSADALRRGDYLVAPGSWPGTSGGARSLGRFLHLFEPSIARDVAELAERDAGDAVAAELVYMPPDAASINMSLRPRLLEYELQIGVHDVADGVQRLSPRDISVGLRGERFILWSQSLQREIVLRESHLLLLMGGPSIIRFLSCLQRDRKLVPGSFPWGPAALSPFTPRLRRGRVVIVPARWRLALAPLRAAADRPAYLQAFARRWLMPEYVMLVEGDIAVPIRWDAPNAPALILAAVAKSAAFAVLEEQFGALRSGWLRSERGCHANEFVATFQRSVPPRAPSWTPSVVRNGSARVCTPLSAWSYVAIDCAPVQIDELLVGVERLVAELRSRDLLENWFFVRYAEPRPQLRLRFRACRQHAGAVRAAVLAHAEKLVETGTAHRYAVESYLREVERYGGSDALDIAERIFGTDSDGFVNALSAIRADGAPVRLYHAVRAALPLVHALYPGDEVDGWLERTKPARRKTPPSERVALRRLREDALAGRTNAGDFAADAGGLRELARRGELARDLDEIAFALLHMHFNRFGVTGAETKARLVISLHLAAMRRTARA